MPRANTSPASALPGSESEQRLKPRQPSLTPYPPLCHGGWRQVLAPATLARPSSTRGCRLRPTMRVSHPRAAPCPRAIVDGLRDSVSEFSEAVEGATPKDVMDLVLITQYFDTLKDIGASSRANSIFIPTGPSHVGDLKREFRQGMMEGMAATRQ